MVRLFLLLGLTLAGCTKDEPQPTVIDDDSDGFALEEDCDDLDGTVNPDAAEVCDGVDNNCDTQIDEGLLVSLYADGDGDGYGDAATELQACTPTSGQVAVAGDCDDTDATIFPDAGEICDGRDNDCDTEVDEDTGDDTYYADADADGFGDPATATLGCGGAGWVLDGADCDDTMGSVYPGADEICNEIDDDCNDLVDDEPDSGATTWYSDADGDNYGDPASGIAACEQPSGTVANDDDCDDTSNAAHPGLDEYCDGFDNNCDGIYDENTALDVQTWWQDSDGDGYGGGSKSLNACEQPSGYAATATDCDDSSSSVNPGAVEICDSIDNDCDSTVDEATSSSDVWYVDSDSDGYGDSGTTTNSCTQPTGYVGNADDCDDSDSSTSPAADEYCDSVDNDCDGTTDEADAVDAPTWYGDADSDSYGSSSTTRVQCTQPSGYVADGTDCDDLDTNTNPGASEYCDGEDDDCDGTADDSAVDRVTYYLDADGDGYGVSTTTTTSCSAPTGYSTLSTDCDDTDAALNPATVWYIDGDGDGYGDPAGTKTQCASPGAKYVLVGDDCYPTDANSYPGAEEICFSGSSYEGKDNDCDGSTDEDCATLHCGTISSDETWSASEDHYVGCNVYVQGSLLPTLTIEDGAHVEFNTGTSLIIGSSGYGDLAVSGTSAGVTFTSAAETPAAGDWAGIQIGSYSTSTRIEGLTVEYAGYYTYYGSLYAASGGYFEMYDSTIRESGGYGMYLYQSDPILDGVTIDGAATYGLYSYNSAPLVTNSTFQNNGTYGIYCPSTDCIDPTANSFAGNVLTGNGSYPIRLSSVDQVAYLDSSSSFSGNTKDYIEVPGGYITSSATWYPMDVPYYLSGGLYVYGTTTTASVLTLEDGVDLAFARYASLYVGMVDSGGLKLGDLVVNGTSTGVTMTSGATTPAAGDWYLQLYYVTSATKITGLDVSYPNQLIIYSGDSISISDLTVTDASSYGIRFDGRSYGASTYTGDLTLSDCAIDSTGYEGILFYGDTFAIDSCKVDSALQKGIYVSATSASIDNTSVTNTTSTSDYDGHGVELTSGTSIASWSANTLTGNDYYPLLLGNAEQMLALDTASTYVGNGVDMIRVQDSTLDGSGTIHGQDVPYHWVYGMYIYKASSSSTTPTVTIQDAEIAIGPDDLTYVYGGTTYYYYYYGLQIGSSGAANVTIDGATIYRHNMTGSGQWSGIYWGSSAKGSITNSDVGYAGYSYNANIYLGVSGISVTNNYLHDSTGYGLYCSSGCTSYSGTISGNTYYNNTSGDSN